MEYKDPQEWVHTGEKLKGGHYDVERHKKERAENGFSDYDFWNFAQYNAWVMINVLERFKTGHGFPLYGEVQNMDDWISVLTEIQEGFKAQFRIDESMDMETYEADKALFKRGMELLTIYYGSLWD